MISITTMDPADLHVHQVLREMPRWEEKDPRFLALVEDVRERGIDVPLCVDRRGAVVDGRHRYWAARRLQLREVPVRVVEDGEVATIIVQSLLQRRHYTASQRAYIIYPYLAAAHNEAVVRKAACLARGAKLTVASEARTIEDLASVMGLSKRLFQQAAQLHKLFDKHPQIKERLAPELLREQDPIGLGAAIAGAGSLISLKAEADAGERHAGGRPESPARQLQLFTRVLEDELVRWDYWRKAQDEARAEHWRAVRERAAELEPAVCDEIAAYHERLAREFKKAARREEAA